MIKTISESIRSIVKIVSVLILTGFTLYGFFFCEIWVIQLHEFVLIERLIGGILGFVVGFIVNVITLGGICIILEVNTLLSEINDKLTQILER